MSCFDKTRVEAVAGDMERHCLGHEGMEGSPVARWARELRGALKSDVSMSAYDLLSADERNALSWVRDHGGIDYVKREWHSRVPHERYEARRQRFLGHIAECETALGRRNVRIKELGKTIEFYQLNNSNFRHLLADVSERLGFTRYSDDYEPEDLLDALDRRLMPDGCEWPRYESGELVNLGDRYECWCGKTHVVSSVSVRKGCSVLNASDEAHTFVVSDGPLTSHGKRVKRPAPKVYDADGAEIREGDRVWSIHLDEPHEWIVIDPHEYRDDSQTVLVSIGDRTGHARPSDLTHRAPVLAADGRPLRVGETVWLTGGSERHVVLSTEEDGIGSIVTEVQAPGAVKVHISPSRLTHQRPVLDADGVPIKVGDTVYEVGENYPPFIVGRLPEPGAYRSVRVVYPSGAFTFLDPERLTHTKPEPPKRLCRDCAHWQKDPTADNMGVCWFLYHEYEGQDCYSARLSDIGACEEFMPSARALAERERGE